MKTYKNLYQEIYQFDRLHQAYLRARIGKRQRREVLRFERDLEGNLIQLQNELIWDMYQTGPYRTFHVHEPKKRMVAALPFRDRVLQHSLVSVIEPIFEKRFIHHSYACRPGRGMHMGANQAQQWLREVKREHGKVYCLKADVAKYFASIDQEILITLLEKKIKCRRTMNLCKEIMSTWHEGLPIGNLTSQLWANVYLHELDIFVKETLQVRRYIRYMDDFVIVHHDKKFLQGLRVVIENFLAQKLKLRLNNKTQIFPVGTKHGRALDFLGYRMWTTHRRLRRESVKRMAKRMEQMRKQYARGEISHPDIQRRIASWLGHAKHAESYTIRRLVLGKTVFKREHSELTP